jgi:hypothetical protein
MMMDIKQLTDSNNSSNHNNNNSNSISLLTNNNQAIKITSIKLIQMLVEILNKINNKEVILQEIIDREVDMYHLEDKE